MHSHFIKFYSTLTSDYTGLDIITYVLLSVISGLQKPVIRWNVGLRFTFSDLAKRITLPTGHKTSNQEQDRHNLRGFSIESFPYYRLKFTGNQNLFEQE